MYLQEKIERLSKVIPIKDIPRVLGIDAREVHRYLRNSRIIDEDEPDVSIRMRIKDTPQGRELAKLLRLKVGVIYPDEYKKCNYGSNKPK